MPYSSILLHAGFATKRRRALISPDLDPLMTRLAGSALQAHKCRLVAFGADDDHAHLLYRLHPTASPATTIGDVKSSITKRLRRNGLEAFEWQRGYWIFSASPSRLHSLIRYVELQRQHHADGLEFDSELRAFEAVAES